MKTQHLNDVLGVGPTGVAVGLFLLLLSLSADMFFELPTLHLSLGNKIAVVLFLFVLAGLDFYHSFKMLPLNKINKELVTLGMYLRVRHPVYFGLVFFVYPAFAFMIGSITALVLTTVYFFIFIFLAKKEESELLNRFGERYARYMNEVPMFIPRLK